MLFFNKASNDDDGDSWKIELPGGGFIQKPGSELNPFTDEPQMANEDFESPEVSMPGTFSSTSSITSRFFGKRHSPFRRRGSEILKQNEGVI